MNDNANAGVTWKARDLWSAPVSVLSNPRSLPIPRLARVAVSRQTWTCHNTNTLRRRACNPCVAAKTWHQCGKRDQRRIHQHPPAHLGRQPTAVSRRCRLPLARRCDGCSCARYRDKSPAASMLLSSLNDATSRFAMGFGGQLQHRPKSRCRPHRGTDHNALTAYVIIA